jgi:hypothetical protein
MPAVPSVLLAALQAVLLAAIQTVLLALQQAVLLVVRPGTSEIQKVNTGFALLCSFPLTKQTRSLCFT